VPFCPFPRSNLPAPLQFFRRGARHILIGSFLGICAGTAYKISDNADVGKQRAEYAGFVAVAEAAEKARLAAKSE
jgi:hypothetical protein